VVEAVVVVVCVWGGGKVRTHALPVKAEVSQEKADAAGSPLWKNKLLRTGPWENLRTATTDAVVACWQARIVSKGAAGGGGGGVAQRRQTR
jgi:hypothetical protein